MWSRPHLDENMRHVRQWMYERVKTRLTMLDQRPRVEAMPATAEEKTVIPALDTRLGKMETLMKVIVGVAAFAAMSWGYVAYPAGRIVTSVDAMKESITELKTDFKEMRKDTAELKADFKSQAGQLDRIEKALVQNPPSHPKPAP
jgi:uncharacterized protein HemX